MSNLLLNSLGREEDSTVYAPESAKESQQFQDEYASLSEKIKQASIVDSKSKEDLELEDGGWENEDSLAAAQRFFSSMVLGWGDEIGLATAASAAYATTDGATWSEIYNDMRKTYDAGQARFEKEHSGAAFAADIAGSIASPVNFLRTPQLAMKGGQAVANVGRAAAEGAVYGAGEAQQGNMIEGAAGGALGGAAGYGIIRGATKVAGKGVDILTRRNIEGDLVDSAGNFLPITLAAKNPKGVEGFLHTLYRDVVGPAFGAKGVIKEQEDLIIKPIQDILDEQKIMSKTMAIESKQRVDNVKTTFKDQSKQLEQEFKNLNSLLKEEVNGKIVPLQQKLNALNSGKAEEIGAKAASDFKAVMDARRFDFREKAFAEALPDGANSLDFARIAKLGTSAERAREVDRIWSQKGYKMLTERKYRFKAKEADQRLKQMILDDDYFKVNAIDNAPFIKMVEKIQDDIGFFRDKNGRVSGEVVAAFRSKLGTTANKATDPQTRRGYYAIQSIIDDMLMEQMPKAAKEAFKRESKKWKSNVILRETVEASNLNPKQRGAFTEGDWVKEAFSNSKYDKRYASGPLVREALSLEQNLKSSEKSIAKIASNMAKRKAVVIEKTIKEHKNKLVAKTEDLKLKNSKLKNELRTNAYAAEEIAANTKAMQQAELEALQLGKKVDELNKLRSPTNPSWFHSLAAHAALGLAVSGPAGAVVAPVVGVAAARGLAAPATQRVLAGQTGVQQSINKAINSDASGMTADILSRSLGRPLGGMLTQ
tara:strand:+ start:1213 stop:3510 length:2298 start_codon:yes stop_codon:yes gene_type:complete